MIEAALVREVADTLVLVQRSLGSAERALRRIADAMEAASPPPPRPQRRRRLAQLHVIAGGDSSPRRR
jgi:hypothetical protein